MLPKSFLQLVLPKFSSSSLFACLLGAVPYPEGQLGTLDAFVHLPAAANSIVHFAQLNNKKRNLSWM